MMKKKKLPQTRSQKKMALSLYTVAIRRSGVAWFWIP
jgi:hypothetical protein